MTLRDAQLQLTQQLKAFYAEGEAAAITAIVFESLTGRKRTEFFQIADNDLSGEQEERLKSITGRLLKQEPVQYVLNEAWFCGLRFFVDHHVLIPRPETEELVELAISNCKFPVDELKILDIGTGSGCIAISLKRRIRKAQVWGCDCSAEVLTIARRNSDQLGAAVDFVQLNFLDEKEREQLPHIFDVIISNPPYIPFKESSRLDKNVVAFEPSTALFVPDNDPLLFYRHMAEFGKTHLNKDGSIYAEVHEDFAEPSREVFTAAGYQAELRKDMQGKNRMVIARSAQQLSLNPFLQSA
jgi:release factor glutamine methyltransferase